MERQPRAVGIKNDCLLMGGPYPKCCDASPPCNTCDSGLVPTTIDVVVSGVFDSLCSDCSLIDGTYTLDHGAAVGYFSGSPCVWAAEFDITGAGIDFRPFSSCLNANRLVVVAGFTTGIDSRFQVAFWLILRAPPSLDSSTAAVFKEATFSTDCCNWTSNSVSYSHNFSSECDWSTASVTVTSGGTCV